MVGTANAGFIFGIPENLGPTVNSSSGEGAPTISADGLELHFTSLRDGWADLWVTKRESADDDWTEPVNLGLTVNSSDWDGESSISADGLELYFASDRPGGSGRFDIWVTKRTTVSDPWGEPVNLGPNVNTSVDDSDVCISTDGLSLYIESYRSGGHGRNDLWVSKRATISDPWGEPANLGATINSSASDGAPSISSDGLMLFFSDYSNPRPGGNGSTDIWLMRRATISDTWGEPVNLGPTVNSSSNDQGPNISADGSTLYFFSRRSGGSGDFDLWQTSIEPVVDLNGDGIVDATDMCIVVDFWGTDEPLCDIGPMPWGDGIVDVQDLIVLAEHLFEEFPPVE
jgi:Tol biopolymer transport system component